MRRMFSKQQIEQSSEKISIEAIGNLSSMLEETMGEIIDSVDTWNDIPLTDENGSMWTQYEISEEELKNHMIVRTLDDDDMLSVKVWVKIPEHITTAEEYVAFAESGEEPFILVKVQSQTYEESPSKYINIGNLKLFYQDGDPTEFYWEGEKTFFDDDDMSLIEYGISLTGHLYLSLNDSIYDITNQGDLRVPFGTSSARIANVYTKLININNINGRDGSSAELGGRTPNITLPNNAIGFISIRNNNYTGLKVDKDQAELTTNNHTGFVVKNDNTCLIHASGDGNINLESEKQIKFDTALASVTIGYSDENNNAHPTYIYDETGLGIKLEADGSNIFLLSLPKSDPHVADAVWNDNGVLKISAGA